jgi:hypothetical protein
MVMRLMDRSTTGRFVLAVVLATLAVAATPGTAAYAAGSTVIRASEQSTYLDVVTDPCRGILGLVQGTSTFSYQEVVNIDASGQPTGFHVHGTLVNRFVVGFADGSHGWGVAVSRPVANSTSRSGVLTDNVPLVEDLTVLDGEGSVIERIVLHQQLHVTLDGAAIKVNMLHTHFSSGC